MPPTTTKTTRTRTTASSSSATSRTTVPHVPSAARTILEFFLPRPQWQSLSLAQAGRRDNKGPPFRIIGIQEITNHPTTTKTNENENDDNNVNNNNAAVLREDLLAHIYRSVSTATWATSMILTRRLPAVLPLWLDVAGSTTGGPGTTVTTSSTVTGGSTCRKEDDHFVDGDLKEVVLYSLYDDDDDSTSASASSSSSSSSLLQTLYQSLPSPVTGVYVTPGTSLRIRPLPPAEQDHQGPSAPTLIFHRRLSEPLSAAAAATVDGSDDGASDTRFRRIGYTGRSMMMNGGGGGQLVFDHPDHHQLGLRLCDDVGPPRSMFAEAQDSLLASSIAELQSNRVVLSKDDDQQKQQLDDPRTNKSDCWVEVRAQLAQPLQHWKQNRHKPSSRVSSGGCIVE